MALRKVLLKRGRNELVILSGKERKKGQCAWRIMKKDGMSKW